VILPVHGKAPWLKEALDSIIAQTYDHLEIVIVLDRPSISTMALIDRLSANEPRAVVLTSPNTGLAAALNFGIQSSKGILIARMDADDIMSRERIEVQEKYFQRDRTLQVLGCQAAYVDESGMLLGFSALPKRHSDIAFTLLWANPMIHPGILMSKELFVGHFSYDETLPTGEDYKLILEMMRAGVRFANTKEILLKYRRSSLQMTSNSQAQMMFHEEISCFIADNFIETRKKQFILARFYLNNFLQARRLVDFNKMLVLAPLSVFKLSLIKVKLWFKAKPIGKSFDDSNF
jgi:glycosyltransferase involved in cell wall biosynthesis